MAPFMTPVNAPGFIAFVKQSAGILSVDVQISLVVAEFGTRSVNSGSPYSSP